MTVTKPVPSSTEAVFPYINHDPSTLPHSIDPFTITTASGFMPYQIAPTQLPPIFKPLTDLLERMPVLTLNGKPGLLATYQLGKAVEGFPDLTDEIENVLTKDGKRDLFMLTAIFRDYSYVASAYILEPCWENWCKDPESGYGLGREVLPHSIAGPMWRCAEILDLPPFLSYAASYALFNYTLENPSRGYEYDNLRLIRGFENGLDPKSSEAGFILTHVDMVKETAPLIHGAVQILDGVEHDSRRAAVNEGFREILKAMEVIEASMEDMWKNSKPADYLTFRVFIFGITSQSMFPNGVIYEGINDNHPMYFRGESGANDAIIPLLDHLLQIPMPDTPLTKILHEFRAYRPRPHREFLSYVASTAEKLNIRDFAVQDDETAILYLKTLDHVRSFRWRHWLFAREYIIKRTAHPTATGGSPIVTWLPNQLSAVMDLMIEIYDTYIRDKATATTIDGPARNDSEPDLIALYKKQVVPMMEQVHEQREKLAREVERWCKERGV
ncbi:Indoleamine 2,3-dioxygenase 1 [Talaromyces pinophilus]|nr:Indoleamine 2,3-dioxygenase 1 [Talaromyces pinophilus]